MGIPRLYNRHDEFKDSVDYCPPPPGTFAHFSCNLKRMSLDIKTEIMEEKIEKTTEQ
jgi:hypothetical protein